MPVNAAVAKIMQFAVSGSIRSSPPILRMSCSPCILWMIDPEQINRSALKNACVVMCKNARSGWLNPMVMNINPS